MLRKPSSSFPSLWNSEIILSPNCQLSWLPLYKGPFSQRCHCNRVTMTVFELVKHVKNEVAQPSNATGRDHSLENAHDTSSRRGQHKHTYDRFWSILSTLLHHHRRYDVFSSPTHYTNVWIVFFFSWITFKTITPIHFQIWLHRGRFSLIISEYKILVDCNLIHTENSLD